MFQTLYSLVADEVRIAIFKTCGCVGSVEVYEEVVVGCCLDNALIEIHHPLIEVIHEVNLHACHAPFSVFLEEIHVEFGSQPGQP